MSKAEVRLLGLTLFLGAVILIALLILSTIFGTTAIPVSEALKAVVLGLGLAEGDMSPLHRIVFELRLPRALFAAVIGAGLGVVGVVCKPQRGTIWPTRFCSVCPLAPRRGRFLSSL